MTPISPHDREGIDQWVNDNPWTKPPDCEPNVHEVAVKKSRKAKYQPAIVRQYYLTCGLPVPEFEFRFHPVRKWRFDLAWPDRKVALEVQGGIWIRGGHNRGAIIRKEWEKLNEAAAMGWRVLFCEPKEVCMGEMVEMIRRVL